MTLPTKVKGLMKILVANVSLFLSLYHTNELSILSWDIIHHIKEFSLASLLEYMCVVCCRRQPKIKPMLLKKYM